MFYTFLMLFYSERSDAFVKKTKNRKGGNDYLPTDFLSPSFFFFFFTFWTDFQRNRIFVVRISIESGTLLWHFDGISTSHFPDLKIQFASTMIFSNFSGVLCYLRTWKISRVRCDVARIGHRVRCVVKTRKSQILFILVWAIG